MRLKRKIIISLLAISSIFILNNSIKSNAALQANGNAGKNDIINNWMINIRRMESAGGTLGLTDTINTTNMTSSASTANNLDIHMQKNTEYGAMAILSASAYGNQSKINAGGTTTGNKSGIVIKDSEWVSAGSLSEVPNFVNANGKYKNIYKESYVPKKGDAISETAGWHGGNTTWMTVDDNACGILRANGSSIFSYYSGGNYSSAHQSYVNGGFKENPTRACIVVGQNF